MKDSTPLSTDSVANALSVLAEAVRPLKPSDRDGIAALLGSFGRDPDGVAFAGLLAGLTASQRQPAKIYRFSKRPTAT